MNNSARLQLQTIAVVTVPLRLYLSKALRRPVACGRLRRLRRLRRRLRRRTRAARAEFSREVPL